MLVGFIKLHRKFREWEWYKDIPTKTLFIELLLRCQYTPSEDEGLLLEEGQLIASRNDLAKDCGLTESQVRTALAHLKSSQEITCKLANNSTKKKTVITIVNWRKYQAFLNSDNQENRQEDNQENRQPLKNIKNINNIYLSHARAHEKPTLEEIKKFCKEIGSSVKPKRFFNYYEATGWRIGGQPIEDWRAVLRNWDSSQIDEFALRGIRKPKKRSANSGDYSPEEIKAFKEKMRDDTCSYDLNLFEKMLNEKE